MQKVSAGGGVEFDRQIKMMLAAGCSTLPGNPAPAAPAAAPAAAAQPAAVMKSQKTKKAVIMRSDIATSGKCASCFLQACALARD